MVMQLTEANFDNDVLASSKPVIVEFFRNGCGHCQRQSMILDEAEKEYGGRVAFGKVNVEEQAALVQRFHVAGTPHLVVFQNGQVVRKEAGVHEMDAIGKLIP